MDTVEKFFSRYFIYVFVFFLFEIAVYCGIKKLRYNRKVFQKDLCKLIIFFIVICWCNTYFFNRPILSKKSLEQLHIAEGYCVSYGGTNVSHKFHLLNGNVDSTKTFYFQLCDNTKYVARHYNGEWIKIWYDDNNFVFQMSIGSHIEYNLHDSNINVNDYNMKTHILPVLLLICIISVLVFN